MLAEVALPALLSGALVGAVLGLIGGGGSILALPLLLYVVGGERDVHGAIGTSALAVAGTAALGVIPHLRAGHVDLRAGLLFALPGVAGALAGARLGLATEGRVLLSLFAVLMLVVAWRMWRAPATARGPPSDAGPARAWAVAAAGLGVGVLAGFFGIGGGFLIVPALLWAARLDMRAAVGTSLIGVAALGLSTAARYGVAGSVDVGVAALFVVGGLAGSAAGARLSHGTPRDTLRRGFAIAIVAVAILLLAMGA